MVRYTVSNMCTQAYQKPFNRRPTNPEVEEMAKSLTLVYPSIKDVISSHVSSNFLNHNTEHRYNLFVGIRYLLYQI